MSRAASHRVCAWFSALCLAWAPLIGHAARDLPPRSAFLVKQAMEEVRLSPDGRHVAWIRAQGELREVWKLELATGRRTRLVSRTPASALGWTRDGRWLVLEAPRAVFAVNVAGAAPRLLTALAGERKRVLLRVDSHQDAIWVLDQAGREGSGQTRTWRVARIDFRGRETGVLTSRLRVVDVVPDTRGGLAWIQRIHANRVALERVVKGRPQPRLFCEALRKCAMLSNAPQGGLWLRSDLGQDLTGLQKLSSDGHIDTVQVDPRGIADVAQVLLDPGNSQPLATAFRSDVAFNHFLQPAGRALNARLEKALPGRRLDIETSAGARQWLVKSSTGDSAALQWHVFDSGTGKTTRVLDGQLLDARTNKPVQPTAPGSDARPVSWHASDGMRLHGFVTLPKGANPATSPVVVNVHGGPWNHFGPAYRAVPQFLASRGYVVFEPNFRASTGFGRDYMLAAHGDFGNGRVQADIVEGVRWLLAQGIGDPGRVGITGASFGGYATLQALTHQADLFKVGVAMVPPPDFGWTLRWTLRNPEALALGNIVPMQDWLRALEIDTAAPNWDAKFKAQSPMANVAKMRRPLLIFAGAQDARVGVAGVIEYAARLKLAGQDVTLMVDAAAGHSNNDPIAREGYLFALETLFAHHLNGRTGAAPDARMKDFLAKAVRCAGKDWQAYQASDKSG